MGHFFAVSVLQSITKGWGKQCKWEYPTAYGLGVIWASSQVFLLPRWRAVVLCAFWSSCSSARPQMPGTHRRCRGRSPVWLCACVQFVRYAFTSVIKCWIWFQHIYQISSSHLSWVLQSQYLLEVSSAKVSYFVFFWSYYKPCHVVPV